MDRKIDQKKYLQKYLNPKKHKKKSQKKPQNSTKRVNIIDDDIDVSQMMPIGNSEIDIYTTGEDAPQIAGIIDERPIDVQLKERFKFNTQWKLINDDDGFNSQLIIKEQKSIIKDNIDEESKTSEGCSQDFSPNLKNIYSDDENRSTRKSRLNSTKVKYSDKNSDFSPPRNKEINSNTLKRDSSPFRKKNNGKESRYCSDSDASPPRKKYTNNLNSTKRRSSKQSDSDTSPPRRNFNKTIKSKQDSDTSPKRKSYFKSAKRVKRDSDLDTSPPRRKPSKQDSDTSPPRKKSLNSEKGKKQDSDSDSPTRKRNKNSSRWDQPDLDVNLPRKYNKNNKSDSDTSPPRKSNRQPVFNFETSKRNSDTSPPRNRKDKNRSRSGSPKNKNIVKFNIRNPDQAEKKLDAEKRKIQEEKYATWGKGLKQVEERREKIDNDSHEMSKPLARYANDEDLENFLKDQEREGDPMLEYIRKQNKTEKQDDKHSKPKYEGAFMPNRFGIPPGYRWDGVDRSNGYEANWFNVQNSKKILQEEAYKWSTDDM